ncbi:MAG: trypsin-like peptidase domain-containing protein [Pseudomonadota bacterium]
MLYRIALCTFIIFVIFAMQSNAALNAKPGYGFPEFKCLEHQSKQELETLSQQTGRQPPWECTAEHPVSSKTYKYSRSVGRLSVRYENSSSRKPSPECSAYVIDVDLIMTNYHCIPGADPDLGKATTAYVEMGYYDEKERRNVDKYDVIVNPLLENKELDYVVLEVEKSDGDYLGDHWFRLPIALREVGYQQELVMFHHPNLLPSMHTDNNCQRVHSVPTNVLDAFKLESEDVEKLVFHTCETLNGSSGSPLMAARGGRFGKVAAIHRNGISRVTGRNPDGTPIVSTYHVATPSFLFAQEVIDLMAQRAEERRGPHKQLVSFSRAMDNSGLDAERQFTAFLIESDASRVARGSDRKRIAEYYRRAARRLQHTDNQDLFNFFSFRINDETEFEALLGDSYSAPLLPEFYFEQGKEILTDEMTEKLLASLKDLNGPNTVPLGVVAQVYMVEDELGSGASPEVSNSLLSSRLNHILRLLDTAELGPVVVIPRTQSRILTEESHPAFQRRVEIDAIVRSVVWVGITPDEYPPIRDRL